MKSQKFNQVQFAFGIQRFDQPKKKLIECITTFLKIYQFEKQGDTVNLVHPEDENSYTCTLSVGRDYSDKLYARLTVVSCERLKHEAKECKYSYKQKYPVGHVFDLLSWMIADISMMNYLRKLKQFGKQEQTGALHAIYQI